MKSLEQILENMVYTYDDCPTVGNWEKEIQKQMPDYEVIAFDMDDEYNSVGATIAASVCGKFVEDIQTAMWNADDDSVYYYVVAVKTREE